MVLSEEGEDQLHKKLLDLCSKLNLDQKTISIAWDNFTSINKNFALEGDSLNWLGCAVFVAAQSVEISTLGTSVVKGNGINLTSLLRYSNLSFVQFFSNINKWADMAHLADDFRRKIELLKDTFGVAHNTFKRFYPIFSQIFASPNSADLENSKQHRSRKLRPVLCNTSKVFEFIWNLFITLKGEDSQCSTDLVKSFHLLYACIDLAFKNAFLAERRDLLNPKFQVLPSDWNDPGFVVPQEAPCLMNYLCKCTSMLTEAMHMKVYVLRPLIGNLINNKVLLADRRNLTGLFDQNNFEQNFKNVVNAYETHLLNSADVDERIFLAEYRRQLLEQQQNNAWTQIGRASPETFPADQYMIASPTNTNTNSVGAATPRGSDTPLTGRVYLPREADILPVSVDKTITQKITRLHNILNGRSPGPSESLLVLFENCQVDPLSSIQQVLNNLIERFLTAYVNSFPSREEEAKNRIQIGITLFYKFIENILENERKIKSDISSLVKKELFFQCMFACCMEIVLFSYNFPNKFPWILDIFEIQPLHFVKVIELIVRSKDQLSRDMVKHLNRIEETILETLIWKSNSSIWSAINNSGEGIPKFEATALPGHLLYNDRKSLTNGIKTESPTSSSSQSPVPSALDRFQSPVNANRQLFSNTQPGQSVLQKHTHIMITDKDGNKKLIPIVDCDKQQSTTNTDSTHVQPRRLGSLSIIFRKFYNLAGTRMEHLCIKLGLVDMEVKQKIWTVFEDSIRNSDLIRDRHLDQLLMCAVYVICRISNSTLKFQDIMKFYRDQPQSGSNVYRDVLISREVTNEDGGTVPEKRSDLISFYNSVYVEVMQKFAVRFRNSVQNNNLLLSPLPAVKRVISPSIQVVGNVFVRPLESPSTASNGSFNYFFSRSPSKDLKDINKLVNNSRVTGKRLLADDDLDIDIPASKRISNRKLQSLVEERRNQNNE